MKNYKKQSPCRKRIYNWKQKEGEEKKILQEEESVFCSQHGTAWVFTLKEEGNGNIKSPGMAGMPLLLRWCCFEWVTAIGGQGGGTWKRRGLCGPLKKRILLGFLGSSEQKVSPEGSQARDLMAHPPVTCQDFGLPCNPIALCLLQVHFVKEVPLLYHAARRACRRRTTDYIFKTFPSCVHCEVLK